MLQLCMCVSVLAVMCQSVMGQVEEVVFPDEWEAKDLPNPDRDPGACHLASKSGFVCDPNHLLSDRHVDVLDWLLRGFYDNDTVCPCSTYWCERTRKGSHASIAIIRKMKLPETFEDPNKAIMQSASNFALRLRETKWRFGTCDNNIIIFYSRDDGALFISYGPTTGLTMNNDVVDYIQRMYGYQFQRGGDLFTGLVQIILAMRQVLNGQNYYDPHSPRTEQLVGGAGHVTSGILATISLALMSRMVSSE